MFNNISLQSFASTARDKLHSAASHGVRDNARLHRWVLLKNSLTNALSRSTENPSQPSNVTEISKLNHHPSASAPELPRTRQPSSLDQENDEYDAFLFPDGDVFSDSFIEADNISGADSLDDRRGSEAQWLNSLLESLEDGSDSDALVTVVAVDPDEEEDEESELMSLLDLPDLSAASMASSTPESILLPPSPPLNPFDSARVLHDLFNARLPITYSTVSGLCDDIDTLTLPDVIEDSSSDTDSESLNTPFTRSTSSLSDTQHSQSPGADQQQPFIRIVDPRDGPPESHSSYPYALGTELVEQPSEVFEQEC